MKTLKQTFTKNKNEICMFGAENKCAEVLVVGVFHGDEPQGDFLINNYIKKSPHSNLLFIPCLNPDGMINGTRQNANGIDLNRNFPTSNYESGGEEDFYAGIEAGSEIETKFMMDVIEEYCPKLILTLHAPFCTVNYDGPAEKFAEDISKIINYPVQADIGYPTPGSFGTYVGIERNIPVITLELDETVPVETLIEPIEKIFNYLEKLFSHS